MKRRKFINLTSAAAFSLPFLSCSSNKKKSDTVNTPSFLNGYSDLYQKDPKSATLQWFRDSRYGLFMHYGVYSILGRGEWVQLKEKIPVSEYAQLQDQFTADQFDPYFITDLAIEAGMKYINITSRHHDSFSLFDTKETSFNSVKAPAKRDLIKDLATACDKKGLGLFLYYSYALDWRHPYFYSRKASEKGEVKWGAARPAYEEPQPEYKYEKDEDFKQYINFVHAQLKEILIQYPNLAGIWFDPIMGYYSRPDLFPIEETYQMVRSMQPQALIAFKQGANGDEDFVAPERNPRAHPNGGSVGDKAWEKNQGKPIEICDTLQPKDIPGNSWGYNKAAEGKHLQPDEVMRMLEHADKVSANLLLNTGPLADGSIHSEDVKTLTEVGKRLNV